MTKQQKEKKPYESPELIVHGDVVQLTHGGNTSGVLDDKYETGTPSGADFFSPA